MPLALKESADLAKTILENNTRYLQNKNIISALFKQRLRDRREMIIFRLTIIDAYYSTQMSKRYFGIEDIADEMVKLSDDDRGAKNLFLDFAKKPRRNRNKVFQLLNRTYGIRKNGGDGGHAYSLISKYAYFLTGFKFPIYDRLVKLSYSTLNKKYCKPRLKNIPSTFGIKFFKLMSKMNSTQEINNFEKLDNLLWLYGKITEGSFSLILKKRSYRGLVRIARLRRETNSQKFNKRIKRYIKRNLEINPRLRHVLSRDVVKFIRFCLAKNTPR